MVCQCLCRCCCCRRCSDAQSWCVCTVSVPGDPMWRRAVPIYLCVLDKRLHSLCTCMYGSPLKSSGKLIVTCCQFDEFHSWMWCQASFGASACTGMKVEGQFMFMLIMQFMLPSHLGALITVLILEAQILNTSHSSVCVSACVSV